MMTNAGKRTARWALGLSLFALVLASAYLWRTMFTRKRPNVVVVVLDTVRASYLDLYGYSRETAPFLAELAETSAVFERAFSTSSWTAPSTASIFTGRYPWRHGIVTGFYLHATQVGRAQKRGERIMPINRFAASEQTLPMRFKALGYSTFGMASNVNIGDDIGFSRGFDRFAYRHRDSAGRFYRDLQEWYPELRAREPFFLYLHLNDSHEPYHEHDNYYVEEEARIRPDRARYLSEIRYTDAYLRAIYDLVVDDTTLFVVVSDHGEEFEDHGSRGHIAKLYTELNRVLMLVNGPGLGVRRARIDAVNVSLIDVLPTILELVDEEAPSDIDGTSLASLVRAESGGPQDELRGRVLLAHRRGARGQDVWAAIDGFWKLIRLDDGSFELYDHRSDPEEHDNVRDQHEVVVGRLGSRFDALQEELLASNRDEVELEVDHELQRVLESLGYVQR